MATLVVKVKPGNFEILLEAPTSGYSGTPMDLKYLLNCLKTANLNNRGKAKGLN
jgi:hypothetical protein